MLMRLWVRAGRIIPLMGREPTPGEPGGELAMALQVLLRRQNVVMWFREIRAGGILGLRRQGDWSPCSATHCSRSKDERCLLLMTGGESHK
jgi:hypothetical protein